MTQGNADIQKIIAFESAFERITEIIFQEGGINGDIVVQDCLQLMINLLKYNISNQVIKKILMIYCQVLSISILMCVG